MILLKSSTDKFVVPFGIVLNLTDSAPSGIDQKLSTFVVCPTKNPNPSGK